MGKGSMRRPEDLGSYQENHDRIFGRKTSDTPIVKDSVTADRPIVVTYEHNDPRYIPVTLDEVRTIVFRTSVAYAGPAGRGAIQEAEWARAAALRDALSDLGFEREAEMIGGAG